MVIISDLLRITRIAAFTQELYLMNWHETLIRTTCEQCLSEIWYNQMYNKCKHSSNEAKANFCIAVFLFGPLLLEKMRYFSKTNDFSSVWRAVRDLRAIRHPSDECMRIFPAFLKSSVNVFALYSWLEFGVKANLWLVHPLQWPGAHSSLQTCTLQLIGTFNYFLNYMNIHR